MDDWHKIEAGWTSSVDSLIALNKAFSSPRVQDFLTKNQKLQRLFNGFEITFIDTGYWIVMNLILYPEFTIQELRAQENIISAWHDRLAEYHQARNIFGCEGLLNWIVQTKVPKPQKKTIILNNQLDADLRYTYSTYSKENVTEFLQECLAEGQGEGRYSEREINISGFHSREDSLENAWEILRALYSAEDAKSEIEKALDDIEQGRSVSDPKKVEYPIDQDLLSRKINNKRSSLKRKKPAQS